MPASAAARLASVFFDTAYVVWPPSVRRSSVISETVRPRYSVNTVAAEFWKESVSSATAAALSARTGLSAMSLLSQCSAAGSARTRGTPPRRAHGAGHAARRGGHDRVPFSLRGPPACCEPFGGDRCRATTSG